MSSSNCANMDTLATTLLLLRNWSRHSESSPRPISPESSPRVGGSLLMVRSGDGDLPGECRALRSAFGDSGRDAKLTKSPGLSSSRTNLIGCVSLVVSALGSPHFELSAGTSADTSTALDVCWSPVLGDGCLLRSPFWKARTDSNLLSEKSTHSYKSCAISVL
jgi:hypothetical protein